MSIFGYKSFEITPPDDFTTAHQAYIICQLQREMKVLFYEQEGKTAAPEVTEFGEADRLITSTEDKNRLRIG